MAGTQGSQGSQSSQNIDPVCGMKVDQSKSAGTSTYQGQTYNFCSQQCKQKFDKSPQQFARKTA